MLSVATLNSQSHQDALLKFRSLAPSHQWDEQYTFTTHVKSVCSETDNINDPIFLEWDIKPI